MRLDLLDRLGMNSCTLPVSYISQHLFSAVDINPQFCTGARVRGQKSATSFFHYISFCNVGLQEGQRFFIATGSALWPVSLLLGLSPDPVGFGVSSPWPHFRPQGVRSQIEDVRAGMLENVDKVLERGEKIEVRDS